MEPNVQKQSVGPEDADVGVFDIFLILAKYRRLILGLPLVAGIIAAAVSYTLTDVYTARTTLVPPQQAQSGGGGILSQLGVSGLAGLVGGGRNNELYIGMMKSRAVTERIVERFDLMKKYSFTQASRANAFVVSMGRFTIGKDGIIAIEVDDPDPMFAADIANAFVDEFLKVSAGLALTDAAKRRLFFERQLEQAKDNLVAAEVEARRGLNTRGFLRVDEQSRSIMDSTSRLRLQIASKEVSIGSMRVFAAERNPELQLALRELDTMKAQLSRLEGSGDGTRSPKGMAETPEGMSNVGLLRNVRYHEAIFEAIARQFEVAKMDEARESTILQVLDRAIPPDRKSKPSKRNIVLFTVLGALFIALFWTFVREAFLRAASEPGRAETIRQISTELTWRKR